MSAFDWIKVCPEAARRVIQANTLTEMIREISTKRDTLLREADEEVRKILPADPYADVATKLGPLVLDALHWATWKQPAGVSFSHHGAIEIYVSEWIRMAATPHNVAKDVENIASGCGLFRFNVYVVDVHSAQSAYGRTMKPMLSIHSRFEDFVSTVSNVVRECGKGYKFENSWQHEGGFAALVSCPIDKSLCIGTERKENAKIPEGWK